jgi:hypothetical protein
MIETIVNDLKKVSSSHDPDSLARELALFNSHLAHMVEYACEAEKIYTLKFSSCLLNSLETSVARVKADADIKSATEEEYAGKLNGLVRAIYSRIDSVRTLISLRKAELENLKD